MSKNKNGNNIGQSKWSNLIKVVTTPLGFYTFVAILIQLIFSIGAGFIPGTTRTVFIYAMLALLLILIIIVTLLAVFKPEALTGKDCPSKRMEEKIKSLEKNLKNVKDEVKRLRAKIQTYNVETERETGE